MKNWGSAMNKPLWLRCAALVVALALLAGCSAKKAYHVGQREMRRENYDQAVLNYSKAVALAPGKTRYTVALERAKLKASIDHFEKGKRYFESGQLDLAIAEFQQTLLLNESNQHAQNELQRAVREKRRREAGPSEIEQLKERARRRDLGPPLLDAQTNIPILLNFQDVELSKIFEAIGKASGINFIFDDKVDLDKPMTIDIGNVTLEKALDILMLQTKNFYKVLDEFTLLVAPDTRQKRQEYEDQVIRTFFLSNADTKTVVTLLRSLLQSRQIAENPDLNSVTIKDTPSKVAIAERIINANDKSKGEVVIDIELLEIDRNVARTIGIDLSSKVLTLQFGEGDERIALNNLDVLKQQGNWTIGVIPSVTLDFLKTDSSTKFLAKPQLRVSEGERGEILIGDRIPIPTTSFNTSQTVGGNIVPITSFTYQNVGITVQVEPRVHHNKEVSLRVQIEASQVTGSVPSGTLGQQQPIIGTRQIQTVIRLRDNETNLLAGLIQTADQDALSGVVGLTDLPYMNRIFGKTSMSSSQSDIIMTLTPRIIRIPDITEDDLATLWVGTEENMQLRGPARNALGQGPFSGEPVDTNASGAAGAAGGTRGGGSVSQISTSPEVERQRATDATPEGRRRDEPAEREQQTGASGTEGPPPAPVGGAPPPSDRTGEEEAPADEDQDRPPSGPAVVRLIPSKPVYAVGETVVVQVVVDNAQNVGSTPFHLRYNTQVLQYLPPGAEGPFMNSDGANTVFLASDTGGGGEIVVGLSRMGAPEGANGAGTLAVFQFQAVAAGDCGFAFTGASVKDPQARNMPAAFNTAGVRVQ
jgi:general secretion pathway protein D